MITYYIVELFTNLQDAFFNLLPTFETPAFLINNLPNILTTVMGFNYYLPIVETLGYVLSAISITFSWKIGKVLLSFFIDLNA